MLWKSDLGELIKGAVKGAAKLGWKSGKDIAKMICGDIHVKEQACRTDTDMKTLKTWEKKGIPILGDLALTIYSDLEIKFLDESALSDPVIEDMVMTCFATEDGGDDLDADVDDEWAEEQAEGKSMWFKKAVQKGGWFKKQSDEIAAKVKAGIAKAKAKAKAAADRKAAACVASMDIEFEQTELLEWGGWLKAAADKVKAKVKAGLKKLKDKKTVSMDMDATMNGEAMGSICFQGQVPKFVPIDLMAKAIRQLLDSGLIQKLREKMPELEVAPDSDTPLVAETGCDRVENPAVLVEKNFAIPMIGKVSAIIYGSDDLKTALETGVKTAV